MATLRSASHLRVEHLGDAVLGLGVRRPRLSWRLPQGAQRQLGWMISVEGVGASARIDSDAHLLVPWPFPDLGSRRRVEWRVKVWTDVGESPWSAPAWFETGLLDPDEWQASWIEPREAAAAPAGERPAHVLRKDFVLGAATAGARLHATAHGIYESFLNGRRVGDLELTPGFTDYRHRVQVQSYDVGGFLRTGANVWEVVLSDGWYRGRHGNSQLADRYGTSVAFLGQLEVGDLVVATGPEWSATTGRILAADLMAGQVEDHRRTPTSWAPVRVADHDLQRLTSSPAPPVRRVEELRPISVTQLADGRQVVDLGQNITGWVRLDDLGPAGTALILVHGEALDTDGDVTTAHLEHNGLPLGQIDRVVSAGDPDDRFEPRHTVHGFQYVRVEGHPDPLAPADVTGVVVHTDLRRTGWFRCSDERLNRLHEIADWSFRDNACDIPTDCPHRERSAWTGDWQVFLPSAAFLYDVAGFSVKWLRDLASGQLPDGLLPNYVPDPRQALAVATEDLTWYGLLGSAGWGDAAVLVPWELYRRYGDQQVLEELWPTIVGWLRYAATSAATKRHPSRVAARPMPAPHEEHLWDGGWHFGEWLEPGEQRPFWDEDQGSVATAFLHRSATLAARIGRLLGHDDEAARFELLAQRSLEAWRIEYVGDDGTLIPDTQANHVRALAFSLVPEELLAQTADRLVALIRGAGTHLGTGFLATADLLPVLADAGHLDVAYDLLLQDSSPSWLTMVDRGASTVWESWEGIDEEGVAHESLNHYAKGAVISFLHRDVVGIRLADDEVAFRRFRVEPRPGGGITWAEGVLDSPYGRIESSWRIADGMFRLTVTVPPGTIAEVLLPDGTRHSCAPGTFGYTCDSGRVASRPPG